MKKLLYIIFLLNINTTVSQTLDWDWAKRPYALGQENGYSLVTDNFGNIYVTGAFSTDTILFADDTLANNGNWDFFILKYNSSGEPIWGRSGGGIDSDLSHGIAVDSHGAVYITGETFSNSMTFTNNNQISNYGNDDIFIAKYDSIGNFIWAKSVGGINDADAGQGITVDHLGFIYITGMFSSSTISFDNIIVTNSGSPSSGDIFIAKYDTDGNCIWAKNAVCNGNDFGIAIVSDSNNDIYITGNYSGSPINFDNISLTGGSITDVFIAKYSSNGNAIWADRAGGGGYEFGKGVSTDDADNVYIVGNYSSSSINFGNISLTNTGTNSPDIFLVKYDGLGNTLWAKSIGGSANDVGEGVSADVYGNVYIIGQFESSSITIGNETLINSGHPDILVAQYDTSGNVVTAKKAGGDNYDYGFGIDNDFYGNVYLTGFFNSSSIAFGNNILGRSNIQTATMDVFISKLSIDHCSNLVIDTTVTDLGSSLQANVENMTYQWLDCENNYAPISGATERQHNPASSSGIYAVRISFGACADTSNCHEVMAVGINETESSIKIYPNPVKTHVTVSGYSSAYLKLSNAVGQIIAESKSNSLSVAHLSQGLYVLQLFDAKGQQVHTEKVIVVR